MVNKLLNIFISLFLFLLPLYFIPLQTLSIEVDKQALLVFFAVAIFFLFALKTARERKISLVRTPFDPFILALGFFYLLSTFISAPNKIESLISPLGSGTILACVLLYFTLTQFSSLHPSPFTLHPLILSSTLVSLFVLFSQSSIFRLPSSSSPLGGLLPTMTFLLPVAVYLLTKILIDAKSTTQTVKPQLKIKNLKFIENCKLKIVNLFADSKKQDFPHNKKLTSILLHIIPLFFLISALIICAFHLLSDQKVLLLPFQFGWMIMMEVFKDIQNFLIGVGPSNFSFAFTVGKPAAINATPFWNAIAGSSSNLVLTITTEAGVLACFVFILLSIKVLKYLIMSKQDEIFADRQNPRNTPYIFSLLTALVLQFLFPGNISLLVLTFILLAAFAPKWEIKLPIPYTLDPRPYLLLPIGLLCFIIIFFQGKFYLADLFYRESIAQANAQKLAESFNFSQRAIEFNPDSPRYFNLSSNLSLAAARNLVQNLGTEATTSANQQNISRFTQLAVAHARRSVELNRYNSQSWGQLGNVYQTLVGSLQDAEKFALDAYNQQLLLDPNSPQVKLNVGAFLMSLGQYQMAQSLLVQAVNLKPDWNNAHYNLAVLLRQTGRNQEAANELQRALDLTPSDSDDYKQVQKQLEQLKSLLPEASSSATPSGKLTPSPKPKPTVKPATPKLSPSANP